MRAKNNINEMGRQFTNQVGEKDADLKVITNVKRRSIYDSNIAEIKWNMNKPVISKKGKL